MKRFKIKLDIMNCEYYNLYDPLEAVGSIGSNDHWIVCLIPKAANFGYSYHELMSGDYRYLSHKQYIPHLATSELLQHNLFAFNEYDFEEI
jgi:hypothetical protein